MLLKVGCFRFGSLEAEPETGILWGEKGVGRRGQGRALSKAVVSARD